MTDKPCDEFCPFSACHACPWKGGKHALSTGDDLATHSVNALHPQRRSPLSRA